uniref:Asl1-like glycosyl hydrolase catalytic domain-containing protein n=1 Tax=Odontella aurita TaxID=265563 RepID=A0A7S4MC25_9STRA
MGDVLLGANEPDIYGSCMGEGVMGRCTAPCTAEEVARGDCPVAHLTGAPEPGPEASANSRGRCDCWTDSHATGVGFWNIPEVSSVYQPLPTCWDHQDCIDYVMGNWKQIAAKAVERGYKYLSAPMVAVSMDWMRNFVLHACSDGCSDVSCGCPTHVSWHYYANDCQPEAEGGYEEFQRRLDATRELMEDFPHLMGAIVNEVGMLNCVMDTPDAICVPNGPDQKYPADAQPNLACPSTPDLPNGLASFADKIIGMAGASRTSDGRLTVVSFTWFNMNMDGGTYNLSLLDDDGGLNALGRQYIDSCQSWADGTAPQGGAPAAAPAVPPPSGNGGTFGPFATNSVTLMTALVALTLSVVCFCCGAYFGIRYASRGRIVESREDEDARGRYELAGVGGNTSGVRDEQFGCDKDNSTRNSPNGKEENGVELMEMEIDREESSLDRLKNGL